MKTKSIWIALTIAITAISAGAQQPAVPADKAHLYVYRVGSMVGAIGYDILFVNDEHLAALRNSNYAECDVSPGPVVFSGIPRVKKTPIAIDMQLMTNSKNKAKERFRTVVEPGKTYYVRWSVGGKMKLVDEAEGTKEMKGLKLAKD